MDKLSEPLKKLVVRQVHSKSWLEAALLGDGFPSGKVTTAQRKVFLQKVMRYAEPKPYICHVDYADGKIAVFVEPEGLTKLFGNFGLRLVDQTLHTPRESC